MLSEPLQFVIQLHSKQSKTLVGNSPNELSSAILYH